MYKNNSHFNFHSLMIRLIFSIIVLAFAILSCRQSEPNPILGKWQPDTNLKTIVVFSDSLYFHTCNGVTATPYKLENYGKELTVNERVAFLFYFEDKIRVSEAGKKTVNLQKIK